MIIRFLLLTLFSSFFISLPFGVSGQNIQPTTEEERQKAIANHQQMRTGSILADYPVRNVGPVVMSGRVTDLAVDKDDPKHFYVAYASGGVFETTNAGNTLHPIFDNQGSLTIGDIAISKADKEVLWVGTGENNSSRSSYAGSGIYKSTDGGHSWKFSGLTNSQHIGRIITHPEDANTVWVASIGALYHHNEQRGVFKTTDGGKTWDKTLFINDSTGVIDLVIHPENPDILWASSWERTRKAWNFKEGGRGSAIYKSTDGGEHWKKVVEGFPQGEFIGRIGLDVSLSNPDILYAVLDNQKESKTKREETDEALTASQFVEMSVKDFLALDNKKLNRFLRSNGFPEKYTAQRVKTEVEKGIYKPKALTEYLGDANEALFDTDVTGAEVYRSSNGGESWEKVNEHSFEALYFTYGYYFGEIRINPKNPDEVYIFGVPFLKSDDGGRVWEEFAVNQNVHVDHHAMWINPNDPSHILVGNDGGVYQSWDKGENFIHHNVVPVGQFYSVAVDMEKPFNIYGGLQDNGVFTGSSAGSPNDNTHWERLFGGDGMHVAVHPENSDLVYTGFQFGNYFRINRENSKTSSITPKHDIGESRYRYNWNTPIAMSHHNPDILFFGSQKLNVSFNRGENWQVISHDLTNDRPQGDVPYSTLTKISESPLEFGTIWAGTDDGNIYVTQSLGENWTLTSESLPQNRWVSDVHASEHAVGTAYASLTGYRYDEFKAYIYKTDDFGQTWTSVTGNLPQENVNTIYQDPVVPQLLYAGTDQGTYVSMSDGKKWHLLNGIPNVASYDMVVHPRDNDLVTGTHGRSIYVADVEPLQKLAQMEKRDLVAFKPEDKRFSSRWGSQQAPFRDPFMPEQEFLYFVDQPRSKTFTVTAIIKNKEGNVLKTLKFESHGGFNQQSWNLVINEQVEETEEKFLTKGTYTATFSYKKHTQEVSFEIK